MAALGPARPPQPASPVAWLGLPGKGLGGMDPQTTDTVGWSGRYEFSPDLDAIARRADPRLVHPQFHGPLECLSAARRVCTGDLSEEEQLLVGTITNNLGFPLSNASWSMTAGPMSWERSGPAQPARLDDDDAAERACGPAGPGGSWCWKSDGGQEKTGYRETDDLRPEQHGRRLRAADDDVLRGGRRAELHRLEQRLPAVRRFQRPVEDRPRGPGGRGPRRPADAAAAPPGDGGCAIGQGPGNRHAVVYRFVLPVKAKDAG